MIFWKEWRRIRGRVFTMLGFYVITAFFVTIPHFREGGGWTFLPGYLIAWAAGLSILPAIVTMDMYAGEKDEGTEGFLFSKPIPFGRLLAAKIGLRAVMVLAVTFIVLTIVVLRIRAAGLSLYFWTRPYVIASILASTVVGMLTILGVTALVSIRAPYQSTALIVGGFLGICIAGVALLPYLDGLQRLQSLWPGFWYMIALAIVSTGGACWLLYRPEVKEASR